MRYFILILALLCITGNAFSGDEHPRQVHSNIEEELDVATLPKQISDKIAGLRPGLSRLEIEKDFEMDGGISTFLEQNYCLKTPLVHGKFIKLELAFQPTGMPDDVYADRTRAIGWTRSHKPEFLPTDVLRSVSKPFLGPPIAD